MAAFDIENWDDDVDFQGDLFTHSVSTVHTNFSSRMSLRSESNPTEDDWHVMLAPNDDSSTNNAIQSARHAGIPIPANVPSSALINGQIKRLGTVKALRPKVQDDDWADDLDFANDAPLSLKLPKPSYKPDDEERDDFDDFTDGSLGIRFAGSRRDQSTRSFSASAMSPSLGSVTAESEDDDLRGLELPEGPVDLAQVLKKRQQAAEVPEVSEVSEMSRSNNFNKLKHQDDDDDDDDDFLSGLDVGSGSVFDTNKLTLHRNIQQRHVKTSIPAPARAPTTTLTFSDKPAATRIPRPVGNMPKPASRLEPVFEPGATHVTRQRAQPTTTSSQFLRNKRSMPVLRGPPQTYKPVPFLPAGASASQSHHITTSKPPSHAAAYHLRRESDPQRAQSPPPRSYSRMSSAFVAPDTPSRSSRRGDVAPAALAREAASKRTVTKPSRKRNFGDGTELDLFDDLPTSVTKESKYLKQPSSRIAPKSVRNIPSRIDISNPTKIPLPDRMHTPAPVTPRSPMKVFQEPSNTPRYLRDTAASRIARESRIRAPSAGRPRSEGGPLMPVSTNWKAHIASRSPHTSPTAPRSKAKRPQPNFIPPSTQNLGKAMTEKGMTFNPQTLRWEGNENCLVPFELGPPLPTPTPTPSSAQQTSYMSQHHHQPSLSPPRPALITPLASDYSNQNIKVVGGMVFDPRRMCWLKLRPGEAGAKSQPSASITEDEEDPFAGLEDLKDGPTTTNGDGAKASDEWLVGEEFDLGPEFIRRQREEELIWRRRCESWFPEDGLARESDNSWRWAIRDIAGQML